MHITVSGLRISMALATVADHEIVRTEPGRIAATDCAASS